MKLSDTPETDNYLPITTIMPILDHNLSGEWIPTDFARKLERERDKAMQALKAAQCGNRSLAAKVDALTRELALCRNPRNQ